MTKRIEIIKGVTRDLGPNLCVFDSTLGIANVLEGCITRVKALDALGMAGWVSYEVLEKDDATFTVSITFKKTGYDVYIADLRRAKAGEFDESLG